MDHNNQSIYKMLQVLGLPVKLHVCTESSWGDYEKLFECVVRLWQCHYNNIDTAHGFCQWYT
jgi:hypothetical protein